MKADSAGIVLRVAGERLRPPPRLGPGIGRGSAGRRRPSTAGLPPPTAEQVADHDDGQECGEQSGDGSEQGERASYREGLTRAVVGDGADQSEQRTEQDDDHFSRIQRGPAEYMRTAAGCFRASERNRCPPDR